MDFVNEEHIADQDIDNAEEVIIRWNKENNFNTLHHVHNLLFNVNEIEAKCKKVIQLDKITNRRNADYNSLNRRQKYANDIIIKAL